MAPKKVVVVDSGFYLCRFIYMEAPDIKQIKVQWLRLKDNLEVDRRPTP
jgi:hypothetical protein